MTAEPADIALLARVLNSDETGLSALLDRHWHSLVRYSFSILNEEDASEDIAQEVFVRLWEHRETWGLEGSVLGLLFRIARNLCLDECRRRGARERAASKAAEPSRTSCPGEYVESKDLGEAIRNAVACLPQRRREVFTLVRQHGLTYREAAEALDVAPQTVANHLSMALADLRDSLAPHLRDQLGDSAWLNTFSPIRYAGGGAGS